MRTKGSMRGTATVHGPGEEGVALITTLLVVLVVGALVLGAIILGSNQILADRYWLRQSKLEGLADGGLEITRSYLNADKSLFPDTGFAIIESDVPVRDGAGRAIPGVRRSTYAGPSTTWGQAGVPGSIVSVVKDDGGGLAVRRQQVFQQSFARFAEFTNNEGEQTDFGDNAHIWGPIHTNGRISIHSSGANFHDEVTAGANIRQPWFGSFDRSYQEYSPIIPMPDASELTKLQLMATAGHTAFLGTMEGAEGEATTRIEFVPVDLNGDGDEADEDEGFFRVYRSRDYLWVSAKLPAGDDIRHSENCGDFHTLDGVETFVSAKAHGRTDYGHGAALALARDNRRCFLGGDDRLWGGFVPDDGKGQWLRWEGSVDPRLRALKPVEADYLFPISRLLNPDAKGVIYVEGKVIVSGKIRGRVTLAASGNIIVGDDLTYATDPGAGGCADVAGYFSGERVVLSNNLLNAPARVPGHSSYYTFDDSQSEFLHGVVLALDIFTAEEYASGSNSGQLCGAARSGRGCLYLTGGIIQNTRGAIGLRDGRGYVERYSYDKCAANQPPPYFPTTGVFVKGQYSQVDPAGFDITDYFALIAPGPPASPSF